MYLGLLTAILEAHDDGSLFTFEEVVDFAAGRGFKSIECACWPYGSVANRRYAGTSHVDVERVLEDDAYADGVVNYAKSKGITISSLGYYSNPLTPDLEARGATIAHLEALIKASAKLNVGMVTTFIGRDQWKTVEDNLPLVAEVWKPLMKLAEESNIKIGIENCPMLFTKDQWPGGQNIMSSPANWEKVFDVLKSDYCGINYDPSHAIWQHLSVIDPIYDFKDKIFHAHAKDIKLLTNKEGRIGPTGYPLDIMKPVIPSHGDVPWGAFFNALYDIGYEGHIATEIEDKAFEGSEAKVFQAIDLAKRYLDQFVI